MAKVRYQSRDDGGHRFWTARYGRYAIRIDANRPGLYRWVITLEGRSIGKGTAAGRDQAADAVSGRWRSGSPDGCNLLVGHRV